MAQSRTAASRGDGTPVPWFECFHGLMYSNQLKKLPYVESIMAAYSGRVCAGGIKAFVRPEVCADGLRAMRSDPGPARSVWPWQ